MVESRHVPRGRGRDAVLDATTRLIAQRGIHLVTMREIAHEARMSLGSTTYHFADREGLIAAAFASHVDNTKTIVDKGLFGAVADGGGVPLALAAIFADRATVLVSSELHLEAARNSAYHELYLQSRNHVARLVCAALTNPDRPIDDAAVRASTASLKVTALDAAATHRDPDDFAGAMSAHLTAMLGVATES